MPASRPSAPPRVGDPSASAGDRQEEDGAVFSGELLRVILIASFGSLLLNLGSTTVNVAIDALMAEFHAPLSSAQWIVTGYLLALALVLPSFRWAVERLGSRRLYVACLLAFTAASALSALAWSMESLIVLRVLQGVVGGLLAPLTQALAAQIAGPKRIGRAVGVIAIPVLVAPLLGPVIGGLLIQRLSWRWLFLINAPLGLLGAWLAHRRLPPGTTATRTPLDRLGLALLAPGIGLFTYAVSSVGRARTLAPGALVPLAAGVVLIVAFVLDARRRPRTALVDLRIFEHRVVGAALVAYLLASFGGVGTQLVFPLYYQKVRGESATVAGLLLAPQGLGMLLTVPQVGKLTDRFNNGAVMIAGVLATLIGTYAFTRATDHSSYVVLSLSLLVRGAGLGATSTPALSAAYKVLTRDEVPNGTTVINIVQRLGAPLGTATMAMTLQRFSGGLPGLGGGSGAQPGASGGASLVDGSRAALASAFAHTFAVSAAASALALLAGIALLRLQPAEGAAR
jgi:EmrB/QacA subfamily drug resistance transporter